MKRYRLLLIFVVLAMFHAEAHVSLLNPRGGETFHPGDIVIVQWQEDISHNTLDWDLYFSGDGGNTWDIIKSDIPLGTLSYRWNVPVTHTTQGQIRIVQDNNGGDYDDISGNFTISSSITGINTRFESIEISVYPNPFTDFSTLEFNNPGHNNHTLTIYDLQGQLVRTIPHITTNKVIIKRKDLARGHYFFQLHTDREVRGIGRLVIE